jgi:hypothetical protein
VFELQAGQNHGDHAHLQTAGSAPRPPERRRTVRRARGFVAKRDKTPSSTPI